MRYPNAEKFDGMIIWGSGGLNGPLAVPGNYSAVLVCDKDSTQVNFEIIKDPRTASTKQNLTEQFEFLLSLRDKLSETHNGIIQIRIIRKQINDAVDKIKKIPNTDQIKKSGELISKELTAVEETLYQTKSKSPQDVLNFPIRLNDKLAGLASDMARGDFKPTEQAVELKTELFGKIDAELLKLKNVIESKIPLFNKLIKEAEVPAIIVQ